MEAANPRQVLFSEAAFREYVGSESPLNIDFYDCEGGLIESHGPIEVYAKHDEHIIVYKMILNPKKDFWSTDDPVSKKLMLVKLTDLPKEIIGPFSENIQRALHIAFIMLTGDKFLLAFEEKKIKFSPDLKRLWAFMPDPETYKCLRLSAARASTSYIENCIQKWKIFFEIIKKQYPNADLKLGLFQEPPYFGGSFLDWERPEGTIHVSPYIWGITAEQCPGYDIKWIGKNPSPIYEAYIAGLQYINAETNNIALKNNNTNIDNKA